MIGSTHRIRATLVAPRGRSRRKLAALTALVLVVTGAASATAGVIVTEAPQAEPFAATFEARAVADPTIGFCRSLPALQKVESRYGGTMSVAGEEYGIHFVLEALVDRSAALGSAEGRWVLTDPRTTEVVGRGELVATLTEGATTPPDPDAQPPDPELELHGLLIGSVNPPDPDLPARKLLGNFAASLGDGATFPHLNGSVGDPTGPTSNPALLLPAVKC